MQDTLRAELQSGLGATDDPAYSQGVNDLLYLDAFTSELLRMYPAVPELTREVSSRVLYSLPNSFLPTCSQVHVDDTLPLTHPVRTASGELVDSIFVAKGTLIRIPVIAINMSEELWGSDAGKFDPKRWLLNEGRGGGHRLAEIPGYKHLLTFASGPRLCLGRSFAVTEIKVKSFLISLFAPVVLIITLGRPGWFSTALQL